MAVGFCATVCVGTGVGDGATATATGALGTAVGGDVAATVAVAAGDAVGVFAESDGGVDEAVG